MAVERRQPTMNGPGMRVDSSIFLNKKSAFLDFGWPGFPATSNQTPRPRLMFSDSDYYCPASGPLAWPGTSGPAGTFRILSALPNPAAPRIDLRLFARTPIAPKKRLRTSRPRLTRSFSPTLPAEGTHARATGLGRVRTVPGIAIRFLPPPCDRFLPAARRSARTQLRSRRLKERFE